MSDAVVGTSLRPLGPGDLPVLERLERDLFGPGAWSAAMLAEELAGPGRWYVGAVLADGVPHPGEPGSLVGYAGLWFDGHDAQVMTIGVDAACQGRGVGRLLLDALVDRARGLGAGSVLLEVRVDNAPALALYRRVGFTELGRRRGYYQPENVDAFTMRLDLAPSGSTPDAAGVIP
ncbi:ribosomal protein S18-alanine N-acetyltransferase [uncultured Cellulomonas sp.]|uniref:ribosomal protein S18-alanine N-acetyltransferase n=1 Tax=uncultured Cellulomonas sp. TaxID=189682 RepID=UPI0026075C71|nr:ribosomal protein S18-alanine N-acetyltransferase [uncultured Cellulomonas sp.]